ncbi:Amidophosphoribosyltransferase [Spatholobus suberectus]|nr:Amidophosphoribosyltransferase [Spatholobus suberectus]
MVTPNWLRLFSLTRPLSSSSLSKPSSFPFCNTATTTSASFLHSKSLQTALSYAANKPPSPLACRRRRTTETQTLSSPTTKSRAKSAAWWASTATPKPPASATSPSTPSSNRGQEGAGIVAVRDSVLHSVTGVGLVSDVFDESKLSQLGGTSAIGHVRYSTAGQSKLANVQPFVAGYRFGSVAVAHNGNFVNYRSLRAKLEHNGSIFSTTSDTEVVLHLIATSKHRPFLLRVLDACENLRGAYSLVFVTEDEKLVAVRDPFGVSTLGHGKEANGAVVFASETCALDLIEAAYEREVYPGEVRSGGPHRNPIPLPRASSGAKQCVFEHIYFALPNSVVFGRSVYESRKKFGEMLATESPVECDVVIAVPDSGVVAALGYAAKAGVPFQQGLIRSHYVGRTFIEPSQKIRDFGVKLKLSPVRAVLEGKRVVVVDDSIVRGTTSSKIVRLIKEAGAKEVHVRIACPPIVGSCYYGVDTPSSEELVSNRMSVEEVREFIGSDSLAFLPLDSLKILLGSDAPNYCYACFSGVYPVEPAELKMKRLGEFWDDGFNGSLEHMDQEEVKIVSV